MEQNPSVWTPQARSAKLASMIHAAMRGKLSCLDSEDALTAAVFGRLKYFRSDILARWFAVARPWELEASSEVAPVFAGVAGAAPEFWPQWPDTLRGTGVVEPDVVFIAGTRLIVVETKLWSGKSGAGFVTGDEEHPADQLAREWKAAVDLCAGRFRGSLSPSALIYLTPHLAPPSDDLDESVVEMRRYDPAAKLYWLSWSSLEPLLRDLISTAVEPEASIATDMLAYLDDAGVSRFHDWRLPDALADSLLDMWHYTAGQRRPYFAYVSRAQEPSWHYRTASAYRFVESEIPQPIWTYVRRTRDDE